MTGEEQERLVEFLRRKMCGPCRRGDLNMTHEACGEASELIAIVESEPAR